MNPIVRKIVFSICTTTIFFTAVELYLRHIQFEGTSIADLIDTAGFPDNSYVHKRDRIMGSWFLETSNGYRSNPVLRQRGFHKETFLKIEKRIFAMGGSTTYGSPFENQERGFPHRLQKSLNSRLRIINVGVAGMDSSAFPAMSKELSAIGAEGIIIYTGNNEIRGSLLSMCSPQQHLFANIKIYQWIQDRYRKSSGFQYSYNQLAQHQEDCILTSLTTITDQIENPESTNRSDQLYTGLLSSFTNNVSTAIENFINEQIHVFLVIPPINLYQNPEYSYKGVTNPSAIEKLERNKEWNRIIELIPNHAMANFKMGLRTNDLTLLRRAAEYDYASRRITPSLQEALMETCQKYEKDVTCIDMRYIEENDAKRFFVDFCHPTFDFGVNSIVESILSHIE